MQLISPIDFVFATQPVHVHIGLLVWGFGKQYVLTVEFLMLYLGLC